METRGTAATAWTLLLLLASPGLARAAAAPAVSEVVVVSPSPVPGAAADANTVPAAVQSLTAADLEAEGEPDVLRTLADQAGGVALDYAQGNPFQPNLVFHGFEASPLQGVAQGLAVYVDGVRFNAPFGDVVNFDLLPSAAIESLTIEGSNPVFGLNALGGSLDIRLKTGLDWQGAQADVSGGSFAQREADAQVGARVGDAAVYLAASALSQAGWRDLQSSEIETAYGDVAWKRGPAEAHLEARFANSILNGPGAAPVQLLAADPAAQFTAPNLMKNQYAETSLRAALQVSPQTAVQGLVYLQSFRQQIANGNASGDLPCDDGSGLLCQETGYSTTTGGAPIPAFLGPSPFAYSELADQQTRTLGYGGSVQLTDQRKVLGLASRLAAGASFDGAGSRFTAATYVGGITADTRVFVGPGVLVDEPGIDTPVDVRVENAATGLFASEALDLTPRLTLTLSGRWNDAAVRLDDHLGGDLSGRHDYRRFDPAAGLAWRAASWLTVYGGYAEANRAPTPAELSCASPADACSLADFFVGDPDLKQVVARTFEAGLRGGFAPFARAHLDYSLGLYRSDLSDDIAFINSPVLGRAYFANIGRTRRQGADANAVLTAGPWRASVSWSHTEATYQTGFVEAGGSNPAADSNGDLTVVPGDRLPGVPRDQVKLGLFFQATARLSLGATAVGQTNQVLFGDEANLTAPLPGFFVVNLNGDYRLGRRVDVFVRIENITDARYATYGTFSPTSQVFLAEAPGAMDPRSYSPAAPIGAFGGVRVSF